MSKKENKFYFGRTAVLATVRKMWLATRKVSYLPAFLIKSFNSSEKIELKNNILIELQIYLWYLLDIIVSLHSFPFFFSHYNFKLIPSFSPPL